MPSRRRVLVLPGLAASDASTVAIRAALSAQGHRTHGWRLGRNEGPSEQLLAGLRSRLDELADRDGEAVTLVGWSLGGLFSHWLARADPELVEQVITMGSPLARDGRRARLDVPATSIYSRNDRVVPWQASLIDDGAPSHENVEVRSLHFTLGFDPAVLHVVADRLNRPVERWKPFRPPPWLRAAFPET